MFKKLVSNLPFNPALINQVSFYAKRLHGETAVRRAGLIFIALTMVIQFFAVISPPQSSLASSTNDMVVGGFSSREQGVANCQNSGSDYGKILSNYGITCTDLANSSVVTLNSRAYNSNLFSMGHLAYGKAGETPININGETLYMRYLWSWDTYGSSNYQALSGTTASGLHFFLLFNCGNLVTIGLPVPPQPCKYNPAILASDSACQPPRCVLDNSLLASDQNCKACAYDQSITKVNPKCVQCPNPRYPNTTQGAPNCKAVCKYSISLDSDSPSCKPCEASQTKEDKTSCLELSKKAANLTENIADANNTTAQPDDVIQYTLTVKNKGKAKIDNYVVQENISDVLDYADVAQLNGGTLDKNNILSWPAVEIPANGSVQKVFTVKIKNPVPVTPASSSDPGHFDGSMTNVYGNTINIKVPQPVSKQVEVVSTSLPNTGPGSSLFIGFAITAVIAYFFARTKLFATELTIIREDFTTSGGV